MRHLNSYQELHNLNFLWKYCEKHFRNLHKFLYQNIYYILKNRAKGKVLESDGKRSNISSKYESTNNIL